MIPPTVPLQNSPNFKPTLLLAGIKCFLSNSNRSLFSSGMSAILSNLTSLRFQSRIMYLVASRFSAPDSRRHVTLWGVPMANWHRRLAMNLAWSLICWKKQNLFSIVQQIMWFDEADKIPLVCFCNTSQIIVKSQNHIKEGPFLLKIMET